MAIIYNPNKKIFTLHTAHTTYQMQVDPLGYLLHLYYGEKTNSSMDYVLTYADRGFSGNPYAAGMDRTYSLDVLPQEYPSLGTGDYRNIALNIKNEKGVESADLLFKSYEIRNGKYQLQGLPAVWADEKEAQTLEIVLEDENAQVEVHLLYGVLEENDVITRSVRIKNTGTGQISIERQRQPVWILYREILMSCGFMESMPWSAIWSAPRWDMERLRLAAAGEHPAISIIRQ